MSFSFLRVFAVLTVILLSFAQCSKPSLVGSDLVDLDETPLNRADTFSMELRSFLIDSFETYRPGVSTLTGRYPLGFVEDPFFGTSQTTLYLEFIPSYGFNEPDFTDAVLDSLILSIGVDTSFIVGEPVSNPTLEAYALQERLPSEVLHSNRSFGLSAMPVGSYTGPIYPSPVNTYLNYGTSTVDTLTRAGFRIHLDQMIGNLIMGLDSTTLVTDSLFLDAVKGFGVRFNAPTQAWIALLANNINTNLTLYYTVSGTIRRQARWNPVAISGPKIGHIHQSTDRQTATYPLLLTENNTTDPVHFVQGMAGLDIQIYFPHLPQQDLILVNKAELTLQVCPLDGEDPNAFGPNDQLEMYTYDDSGNIVLIDDVIFSLKSGTFGLQNYFGGVPKVDMTTGKITYRFNVSAQVQRILEGKAQPFIYIRARNRSGSPARTILCGFQNPDTTTHPKLTITYTQLTP